MSNITGDEGSFSSGNTGEEVQQRIREKQQQNLLNHVHGSSASGPSDPNAEVVALSPTTLMATNRFVCEICNKGFQRDQNLQLHRRGHNLPWKLRQRTTTEVRKRVYICPEPSCVHHNPARALGDLTGIKKHFSRKHGEKKWKCDKCSKKYAVQSDWKAHQKTCGTREYKCDCGTIFSRRDSFITHRAFCDALAEENNKVNQGLMDNLGQNMQSQMPELMSSMPLNTGGNNTSLGMSEFNNFDPKNPMKSLPQDLVPMPFKSVNMGGGGGGGGGGMFSSSSGTLFGGPRSISSSSSSLQLSSNSSSGFNYLQDSKNGCLISGTAHMSATALLQKAAQMGATASSGINSPMMQKSFTNSMAGPDQQLSSTNKTPAYGSIQKQHNASYDQQHFPSQAAHEQQSNMMMQKATQDMSQLFDQHTGAASTGGMNNDMGIMFTGMYMSSGGGDHQGAAGLGFTKNMENEDSSGSSSLIQAGRNAMERNSTTGPSRFGGSNVTGGGGGGGDMMTLDFMGIGGTRPANLHEQQQQRMELEAMSHHQRVPMMTPFHQQQLPHSHGDSVLEKPTLWDA
ncbi:hypothetical protein CICLE_v10023420mg [Citrus x clementina]|uniref:Uncharacterized protein n=2 Tax=Citrus TaxID=2706 RepID=A0ACB8ML47_CITSI|nr:hypothetical protein CICLE_v10023420mg [Citrus x clementina]KAH9786296.1 hypothetical protein KPL71_010220 [Citrus sinensis]